MKTGYIHSFESMGLVDGPGIRTVVFFQGCTLRCSYCHNPDTWDFNKGKEYTAMEVVNKIRRFKPYFKNNGGVTFSGGEPMMQAEFLIECLKECKKEGIHTVIDTSAQGLSKYYAEILKYTDLVLLDIKDITNEKFKLITGQSIDHLLKFIQFLNASDCKVWIRHVVVPGLTDSTKHIEDLIAFIKQINNVEKVELLPYHTLGVHKYNNLGLSYKLKNVPPMDKINTKELEAHIKKELHI